MDAVGRLLDSAPAEIEVKRLAGRIVWLREGEQEWLGPAEVALALAGAAKAASQFWAALAPPS